MDSFPLPTTPSRSMQLDATHKAKPHSRVAANMNAFIIHKFVLLLAIFPPFFALSFGFQLPSSPSTARTALSFSTSSSSTMTTSGTPAPPTTTLGPASLRGLVQSASREASNANSLDLSGIVWLEHLNLVVGSMSDAKKFYVDFLGLTPDSGNAKHFNLGQQQFHLAANEDPPQRVTGSIGLTVPSLERIRERTKSAQSALEGTLFSIIDDDKTNNNSKIMTVTCPWGNIFHLYDISIDDDVDDNSKCDNNNASQSHQKMVKFHAEGGSYGPHRMAVRGGPGIRYVEIACPVGTIDAIANFYSQVLGCNVVKHNINDESQCAIVSVGPGVQMVFATNPNLSDDALEQMKGVHACIYISSFQSMYNTLKERDLIWTNPRFTHLDSCDTWEEACASRTFRFKDIVDVESGATVLELEHETRPMMHGQFLKVPNYEPN